MSRKQYRCCSELWPSANVSCDVYVSNDIHIAASSVLQWVVANTGCCIYAFNDVQELGSLMPWVVTKDSCYICAFNDVQEPELAVMCIPSRTSSDQQQQQLLPILSGGKVMVLALPRYICGPNVSELCACVALGWGIVV